MRKMKVTDFKLEYEKIETNKEDALPVIIVAAGSSTRMNGINKQFTEICGVPVLARTMSAFENSSCVSRIIVVTKEEYMASVQKLAESYMISKLTDIVCGGSSRQISVLNGMNILNENETKVLIHDGARPLVSQTVIKNVTDALKYSDSVCCGIKITDTVKSFSDGKFDETLDRNKLFTVQTPQGVNAAEYRRIITENSNITDFTDDTSVLEYGNYKTVLVEGDRNNIKITTPNDIRLAEFLLKEDLFDD